MAGRSHDLFIVRAPIGHFLFWPFVSFFLSFFAFLHAAFSSPPYLFAYFETTFALHYNAAAPNTDGAVIDPFGIYRFLTDFEQKTLENIVSLNRNKSFIAKFVS